MTTPTEGNFIPAQPTNTAPVIPPARTTRLPSTRQIVSTIETVAFIAAVVLQALGYSNDAIITALAGASAHGINHQ